MDLPSKAMLVSNGLLANTSQSMKCNSNDSVSHLESREQSTFDMSFPVQDVLSFKYLNVWF